MKLTVNQLLALLQAEIAKADGPIKNTASRQVGQLTINVDKLGIGGNEVLSLPEPPPPSGKRLKKPSKPRAGGKSASSTTGRRN